VVLVLGDIFCTHRDTLSIAVISSIDSRIIVNCTRHLDTASGMVSAWKTEEGEKQTNYRY